MKIVTNSEMRSLDKIAVEEFGYPSLVLMENAGLEAGRIISTMLKESNATGEVLIFCGKGKNGGDGLVVARHLLTNGHRVRLFLLHAEETYQKEAKVQLDILQKMKARISFLDSVSLLKEYFNSAIPPFIAVDAILGTGIRGEISGLYYDVIDLMNQKVKEIISLDIPSGIDGDTGRIAGIAVNATATIAFGYPRLGHFLAPGASRRGKLYNIDLTFPRDWWKQGDLFLLSHKNIAPLLQGRDRFGHKNSFGHCLLIGGSPGRLGAIEMASHSCLKMGTGLVTVASWEDSFPSIEVKLASEIMNLKIEREGEEFRIPKQGLSMFTSVVIGPGFGLRKDGESLMKRLLSEYAGPIVVDADGLNLVADYKLHSYLSARRGQTILTPHPGEMARLLGVPKEQVVEQPLQCVREAVDRTNAVVVLKGATSLIHSAEGVTWLNHYPNDGMATAGSGDVLAGMIGGLVGQRMPALDATRLGVYLHSLSGRFAAEERGHRAMTARDLIGNVHLAFRELRNHKDSDLTSHTIEVV